jgi:8-oxo-dGTP pyrophosphatase MutT (NUDIX family)
MNKTNFCLPVVSAIIEREKDGEVEILIQTRWKFNKDPVYSGTIEIPAGKIPAYENVYDAVHREVLEETGLKIIDIYPNIKTKTHNVKDDGSFAFQPFCCQQQIKNGQPWIGFVFICKVKDEKPKNRKNETKDVRWIKKSELKQIFEKTPEKIFTLQLGVLEFYFNKK